MVVDLLLLGGNVAHYASNDPGESATRFGGPTWNGDADGSFVEILGHVQVVATAVVLLVAALFRRSAVHAAWALAFTGILLDDFLQGHGRLGRALSVAWSLPEVGGLRAQDLGEVLIWGAEAVVLGSIVVVATALSSPRGRRDSLVLLGCTVVIAIFGVGVDQAHIVLEPHLPHLAVIGVTLTETTGELGGMSLALLAAARMLTPSTAEPAGAAEPARTAEPDGTAEPAGREDQGAAGAI